MTQQTAEQQTTHEPEVIDPNRPAMMRLSILDAEALVKQAIDGGADVDKLERLIALAKEVHAQRAKMAWFDAMAEFQRRCPPIKKNKEANVETRSGGGYSYDYSSLDAITTVVFPVLGSLGLSLSWSVRQEGGSAVGVKARVSHAMGHFEESGELVVPVVQEASTGHGAMGANPAQRLGVAISYGKRYSALIVLGVTPEGDEDEDGQKQPGVRQPERASRSGAVPNPFVGTIDKIEVDVRKGQGAKGPWSLSVIHAGGQRFGTFSSSHVKFAKEARTSPVAISWEETDKGKNILSIDPPPPAGREPGDEEPGA